MVLTVYQVQFWAVYPCLLILLTLTATLWGRASPFYRWGTKKQFAQDQISSHAASHWLQAASHGHAEPQGHQVTPQSPGSSSQCHLKREAGWMSQAGGQPASVDASIAHWGKVGGAAGKLMEMNRWFLSGVTNDVWVLSSLVCFEMETSDKNNFRQIPQHQKPSALCLHAGGVGVRVHGPVL